MVGKGQSPGHDLSRYTPIQANHDLYLLNHHQRPLLEREISWWGKSAPRNIIFHLVCRASFIEQLAEPISNHGCCI